LTETESSGAPFADTVNGQDGCGIVGTGEKGAGGMAFVVVSEHQPGLARCGKALVESAAHVKFVLQPERHGQAKALETNRGVSEIGLQQAVELRQRLVVKGDVSQLLWFDSALFETIHNGIGREAWVVLFAREAFLLRGGRDVAVHD